MRCWIRASRDAEVRFPSWKISPPCSSSFEVCRWGLKPHGVNILVELSVCGMPSYNRQKHQGQDPSDSQPRLSSGWFEKHKPLMRASCSQNQHDCFIITSFVVVIGRSCLRWEIRRKMGHFDLCFWARKGHQLLRAPTPIKSVCDDPLFATSLGQSYVGEARHLGLEFSRFLSRTELFLWTSVPLRMRQGEFKVREGEKRGATQGLLRMDLEKFSVAPMGQERCQNEWGVAAGAEVNWRRMEKWRELEGTENVGAEEEIKEQRKKKWGRGRRQTPALFLEPEVSQS